MKYKKFCKIIIYGLIVILFLIFIYMLFSGNIYFAKTYIDINSGDVCKDEYIVLVKFRSQLEKTEFSELIYKLGLNKKERVWKLDNTEFFSILRKIYDFTEFHGSINVCESFSRSLKLSDFSDNEANDLIRQCFFYLQKGEIDNISILTSEILNKM